MIMVIVEIIITFLQGLGCAIGGYLLFHLKFPKISPWFGFGMIFSLGLITTILIIFLPFKPFIEPSGALNWGVWPPILSLPIDILRGAIFLVTMVPLSIIFFHQFMSSKDYYIKMKSLGLSLAFLFGLATALIDFLFETFLPLGSAASEYTLASLSLILLVLLLLTQKSPPKKEYIPAPTYPEIPW